MKPFEKLLISIIFFLAINLLVPPFFKEGRAFDVWTVVTDENGKMRVIKEIYFDNVFFTFQYAFYAWVGFATPVALGVQKYPYFTNLGFICSAWCLCAFAYEVANLFYPLEVFNDGSNTLLFSLFVMSLPISITVIYLKKKWIKP